ncbi:MAG: 1-(5-phosphoribosyl)-5-[(5-phosphoribosylamino)methylideneamino] imidazole-4-carboxamide isomerase [Xanthomonadales bacterium]|nr:1-(5-phosphoribosyl)-5-[(5-phosphoribosylamino)methylideneamino] imidazole-4-carboxamide isomerase [Gammaproteobacteria bacterium]MBT8054320.1 1-(5-phosphoribosyl)-5-[(5-phosphoribosylamino)methylideneamino] imidazole-4-carboxamide isomerase [Gammaproteobacteria bacterium]NND57487.1 1-(5-phosphoribosyl)-5-[(5-phosphoribosylamino)methylideneamino] imidazole-4-carboxamide isomerase [Xanthomonadales bacterium]NNK51211.1 1-(5-phosphoribosyl)-5-[(5-phosphoribosylamino)methylideneamino] imidazole-4
MKNLQILPAIDLLDGSCVRLLHGDFKKCKVYEMDAVKLADTYAQQGAKWLHVVDLAASRDGESADIRPLLRLLGKAQQSVQTGGGVRDREDIRERLDHGASRVVVGSVSVTQPDTFSEWLTEFGTDRLVAALDVRMDENGIPWPRTHGWTRGSGQTLWQLLDFYADKGLKHLLCTDIGRDGAMSGPNIPLYQELAARYPELALQASGGVSGLQDLRKLARTGADSAITGKALLEGCFTVAEAIEALS